MNTIPAHKRAVGDIDFGFVGDVNHAALSADKWELFLQNGMVPVVAPLEGTAEGHILNTNADTIASSLAVCLSAVYSVRLIYCFEKKGSVGKYRG